MTITDRELKEIKREFETFSKKYLGYLGDDHRRVALVGLCEDFTTKLVTCPASSKLDRVGAFPGGLIWHSNNVCRTMIELDKVYDTKLTMDEIITVALFHDLGKIGNEQEDYFVPQTSEWHANKLGAVFETNKTFNNTQVGPRSIWWLNNYGVKLSEREINAILAVSNIKEVYGSDVYNADPLTMILLQAVQSQVVLNKGYTNILLENRV